MDGLWWLAGGIVCTLLNLALVPGYGGVGAAVAQMASFGLISLASLPPPRPNTHALNWTRLTAAMVLVLATGVYSTPPWHGTAAYSLLMKLPIGIAVAIVVAWIMAPDWCLKGIRCVRRRAFH